MHIQPLPFFVNLSMDEFAEQYEGHPKARHLNQGIYDMYRVIPNQMEQTGEFQAGIQGFPMHLSLYSMLVWGLLKNERVYTEYEGAMVARCGLDGEGGSKIIHNFFSCSKSTNGQAATNYFSKTNNIGLNTV